MSANNYLITVLRHGINDTTFPMTQHSNKMTRDSRHGIIYFWKFSMKSFNQWIWGQGIKIWKNPYMGSSRALIGRCPCGDDNFFENSSQDFLSKIFCSNFSPRYSWDQIYEILFFLKIKIVLDTKLNCFYITFSRH